ncbi:MAG: Ig-like domain-containing protein [Oscillospiraceae bacterium]|jgi:uncharacterized protein YjdB/pimeloyl-ACP methyl ester carboxylesterase|nr:Ig-like domain-containing protein [Oscillospiraceae bacterium]
MKKRTLSIVLSVLMIFTFVIPVYASEKGDAGLSGNSMNANALPENYVDNSNDGLWAMLKSGDTAKMEAFSKTLSPSSVDAKVDVVFVIDSTGSMASYIAGVKNNVAEFAQYLSDQGITLRVGVVEYRDILYDGINSTIVHRSSFSPWMDIPSFVNTLTTITAYGGGDTPETPIDALGYLVDDTTMLWSSDAYKFAVLLTDAPYHIDNRHGYTSLDQVADKLAERDICTSVITYTTLYSTYAPLTLKTGGVNGDINSSNYASVLKALADSLINVTLTAKNAIIVLPGYMGSELYGTDALGVYKKFWINVTEALNETSAFNNGGKDVRADRALDQFGVTEPIPFKDPVYKKLITELRKEFQDSGDYVVDFSPYNWIGDLNDSVTDLENYIQEKKYEKVIFVTHSTGALLASGYVAKSLDNKKKVEKAILIAPPLYGTFASLYPIETGSSGGNPLADLITSSSWVKSWAKDSPTTNQLLPSREYLEVVPGALTLRTGTNLLNYKETAGTWDDYYKTLTKSKNTNSSLIDDISNSGSHRYFRDVSLKRTGAADVVGVYDRYWDYSSFREIETTIIATPSGHDTPYKAVYDVQDSANPKLVDIKKNKNGDGTVYNASARATDKNGNNRINTIDIVSSGLFSSPPSHGALVDADVVIKDCLIPLIRGTYTGFSASRSAPDTTLKPLDVGMESEIKLRIESDKNITTKVFDSDGKLVGETTGNQKTGFLPGSGVSCDTFGDAGETMTSIYMPTAGYTVKFYYGDKADVAVDVIVAVYTLDSEGDPTAAGYYIAKVTTADGELFTLDMLKGVTKDNIGKLAVGGKDLEIITDTYEAVWELDTSGAELDKNGVVTLRRIGDKVSIGVKGDLTPEDLDWVSSDPSVITVDAHGVLTAVNYGEAIITAMAGGSSKTYSINAKVILTATSVKFDDVQMEIGEQTLIRPVFTPTNVTERDVTYTYNKENGVLTIEDGVMKALKAGVVVVTGTASGGATSTFTVTVVDDTVIAVQSVSVDPNSATIRSGAQSEFKANIFPLNATNRSVTWHVENTTIAEVVTSTSSSCFVKGLQVGVTRLVAVSVDGGYVGFCDITVTSSVPAITSIKICTASGPAPSLYSVPRNSIHQFGVLLNNDATIEGVSIVWTVSDTSGAAVDANGKVTINNKSGMVILTAKEPVSGLSAAIVLRIT